MRPYPKEWERSAILQDGTAVQIRPVRPEDERLYAGFFARVTPEDLRLRFFAPMKEFSPAFVARLTHLDYSRAMAFVALKQASGELLGVVRLHAGSDAETGEYAILVRSDLKGRGLGWLLMQTIAEYARASGFRQIEGQVLRSNTTMLTMCREFGFVVHSDPRDPEIAVVKLDLLSPAGAPPPD